MHQLIRSRKLLEHSRIAHARLEGGRSNRRSYDDLKARCTKKEKKEGRLFRSRGDLSNREYTEGEGGERGG